MNLVHLLVHLLVFLPKLDTRPSCLLFYSQSVKTGEQENHQKQIFSFLHLVLDMILEREHCHLIKLGPGQ